MCAFVDDPEKFIEHFILSVSSKNIIVGFADSPEGLQILSKTFPTAEW